MTDSLILVSIKDKVQTIQLNRPNKKNAINVGMYKELTGILNNAALDDNIIVSVLTGTGDYYSSGNDVSSFQDAANNDFSHRQIKNIIQEFVEAFIKFPKILIGIMNGPAIGIAATTLALCDVVYASEKASEILLFGQKVTSEEALRYGFVSELYSSKDMLDKIWNKIYDLTSLPQTSLMHSKKLLKDFDKDFLILANIKECSELEERFQSEEFITAMISAANIKKRHAVDESLQPKYPITTLEIPKSKL